MARLLILLLVLALIIPMAESRIRYRPYRPIINQRFSGRTACADWQNAVRNNGYSEMKRFGLSKIRYVRPEKCPWPRRN